MPPSCLYKSLLLLHRPSLVDTSARVPPPSKKGVHSPETEYRRKAACGYQLLATSPRSMFSKVNCSQEPLSNSPPSHRVSIPTPIISAVEPTTPIPNVGVSGTPISGQIHMHNRFLLPSVVTVDLIMIRGVGGGCVARSTWSRSRIAWGGTLGLGLYVSLL